VPFGWIALALSDEVNVLACSISGTVSSSFCFVIVSFTIHIVSGCESDANERKIKVPVLTVQLL